MQIDINGIKSFMLQFYNRIRLKKRKTETTVVQRENVEILLMLFVL